MVDKRTPPAWAALEARLRSIEQGDLIGFGAIGVAVHQGSAFALQAGLVGDESTDVVSLSVETASGWYAVLTQDCDVVRSVADEPCLTVAPVLYVPRADWTRLASGFTSYRQFALPVDKVAPIDDAHSTCVPREHAPVVDIRYVGSVDKTALFDVQQRHVLVGQDKRRFQEWVGQRFGRESFADAVHQRVLPAARKVLEDTRKSVPNAASKDAAAFVSSVCEWYVRCTDRYVEVMGRLDADRGRAASTLTRVNGQSSWNTERLHRGGTLLARQAIAVLRGGGYAIAFTAADFDQLSAREFETYALWVVQDEPSRPVDT